MDNKIVFLINTLKVGGAAKMLKYVANLLTEIFKDVTIVSLYDESYNGKDVHDSIRIVCLGFEHVSRIKRQFIMVPETRKAINKLKPDFVCSFISHVCFIGRLATIGDKNIKYLSAERGDPYTQSFIWKSLIRWTFRRSDYSFFQLDGARDFFDRHTREKSFVIPNPFIPTGDMEPYNGVRKKTIISAGRFAKEKCYDILIDAFANVLKKHPEYRLILCGDGPMLPEYKNQIAQLGIQDKVSFPGYVKSVSNAVREEGIFVLSSLYEGIPNSLIEAMAVGIPCVSTDCSPGGPRFLTNNGERGLLIPTRDVNAMTKALLELIEDSSKAEYYAQRAMEVIDDLNEEKIRMKWESAFRHIIKECSNVKSISNNTCL